MEIVTSTVVRASGHRETRVRIADQNKVVVDYMRRRLPLGHLRLHTDGTI